MPTPEPVEGSGGITGAGLAATLTRPAMVVILWLGVIFHSLALLHQLPSRADHFDFSIYYASGLALREHIDPYKTDLDRFGRGLKLEIDPIHYATDPPTFLLCFEPLTLLHFCSLHGYKLGATLLGNGAHFTAASAACSGWNAGDRITLLAGDWHGRCVGAVFYNVARHRACPMWCG